MKLLANELVRDSSNEQTFRVLWVDPSYTYCFLINITEENALPFERKIDEVIDDIVLGDFAKVKEDPFFVSTNQHSNDMQKQHRDRAWGIISGIVDKEPDSYEKSKRGLFVRSMMKKHGGVSIILFKLLRLTYRRCRSILSGKWMASWGRIWPQL